MLKKSVFLLLASLVLAPSAHAGVYSESLGKCMIERSTDADKQQLVEWIFSAIALNPQISQYARITPEQRHQIDAKMATLFERLLFDYCPNEAAKAFKYEGNEAMGASFELLGKVAGTQIFNSPEVSAATQGFIQLIDIPRLQELMGIPPETPKK